MLQHFGYSVRQNWIWDGKLSLNSFSITFDLGTKNILKPDSENLSCVFLESPNYLSNLINEARKKFLGKSIHFVAIW